VLNKIDCSNVLKDGKIEGIHNLLNSSKCCSCCQFDLQTAPRPDRKSHESESSANGDVISRMHFAYNNRQIKQIFKWYNGVHEVDFYNIWTVPESKKGSTSHLSTVYNNWI